MIRVSLSLSFFLCLCLSLSLSVIITPQNAGDPAAVDQLMSSLDENNDGELTFLEFWQLVGKLASQKGGFGQ